MSTSWRFVVVAAGLAIAVPAAHATTFVATSERDLARAADAIVIGTVEHVESVARRDGALVTLVTITVEQSLKGTPHAQIVLRQPGGRAAGRVQWVSGSPRFTLGERDLLFLSAARDGSARTTGYGLGQFRLVGDGPDGATRAERRLGDVVLGGHRARNVRLPRLLRTIARAVATDARPTAAPVLAMPPEATEPGLERATVDAFTFMDTPGRWHEPDEGTPVTYQVDPGGDTALGPGASLAAIDAALAAWTNVSGATIELGRAGAADGGPIACDGASRIVFNDPGDDMPSPRSCSGILALGGFCASADTDLVGGVRFYRITEGDISFNRGFGSCAFWTAENLGEVATHELGHTIGLGHSSESDDERDLTLKDATMYYRAHFDGRGPVLRADDLAAVRALYPGPGAEVGDIDGDGIIDADDDCPEIANAKQMDVDDDGYGDLCDPCPLTTGGTCEPIFEGSLRFFPGARARMVFRGLVSLEPGGVPPAARARLVAGRGVIVDTAGLSGGRVYRSRRRFRGDRAELTLKRARSGAYHVHMTASDIVLDPSATPLVSVSLEVGEHGYATTLTCTAGRRGRLDCRS